MKLGAEPKKLGILIALLVVAAYLGLSNLFSSDNPEASYQPPAKPVLQTQPPRTTPAAPSSNIARYRREARGNTRAMQEFRPSMKRRPEDRIDPTTVDPTLRVDLLARLESVGMEGGERSLFDFGQPPRPPEPKQPPEPKIIPKTEIASADDPKVDPPKPPPPPIPLKFYGFINPVQTNDKRAFFLDGEDIIVASEGEMIRKRYKVVRIGVNSVVMEDLEQKHQQTLPIVEDQLPG